MRSIYAVEIMAREMIRGRGDRGDVRMKNEDVAKNPTVWEYFDPHSLQCCESGQSQLEYTAWDFFQWWTRYGPNRALLDAEFE